MRVYSGVVWVVCDSEEEDVDGVGIHPLGEPRPCVTFPAATFAASLAAAALAAALAAASAAAALTAASSRGRLRFQHAGAGRHDRA